jgi:hypothetical protein
MYSPKLDPLLVHRLYRLCQQLEVPMPQFVNQVVEPAVQQAEEQLSEAPAEVVLERLALVRPRRGRKHAVPRAHAAG